MNDESSKLDRILTELTELRALVEEHLPTERPRREAKARPPKKTSEQALKMLSIEFVDAVISRDQNRIDYEWKSLSDEEKYALADLIRSLTQEMQESENATPAE